jgi:hypothetical protein
MARVRPIGMYTLDYRIDLISKLYSYEISNLNDNPFIYSSESTILYLLKVLFKNGNSWSLKYLNSSFEFGFDYNNQNSFFKSKIDLCTDYAYLLNISTVDFFEDNPDQEVSILLNDLFKLAAHKSQKKDAKIIFWISTYAAVGVLQKDIMEKQNVNNVTLSDVLGVFGNNFEPFVINQLMNINTQVTLQSVIKIKHEREICLSTILLNII